MKDEEHSPGHENSVRGPARDAKDGGAWHRVEPSGQANRQNQRSEPHQSRYECLSAGWPRVRAGRAGAIRHVRSWLGSKVPFEAPGGCSSLFERGVELPGRWLEVDALGEVASFLCSGFSVHSAVFPFD